MKFMLTCLSGVIMVSLIGAPVHGQQLLFEKVVTIRGADGEGSDPNVFLRDVDSRGRYYLVDPSDRVEVYDSSGAFFTFIGTGRGDGPNEYRDPVDIAVLEDDSILIAEQRGAFTVVDPDSYRAVRSFTIGNASLVGQIAYGGNSLYINHINVSSDYVGLAMLVVDREGNAVRSFDEYRYWNARPSSWVRSFELRGAELVSVRMLEGRWVGIFEDGVLKDTIPIGDWYEYQEFKGWTEEPPAPILQGLTLVDGGVLVFANAPAGNWAEQIRAAPKREADRTTVYRIKKDEAFHGRMEYIRGETRILADVPWTVATAFRGHLVAKHLDEFDLAIHEVYRVTVKETRR